MSSQAPETESQKKALQREISFQHSQNLPSVLQELHGSLLISTYQAGKVVVLAAPQGKLDLSFHNTVLVDDINTTTSFYPAPSLLTDVGGTLFYTADDGIHGTQLWKSDGTAAGTFMVADDFIGYSGGPSHIFNLTNVNGTLFFTADDGIHGTELWKSDGTAAGTVMVDDINPGSYGSFDYSGNFTNVNGTVFFSANDGTHGAELWKTDGTAAGTVMVDDIDPGSDGSWPGELTNVSCTLFFTANDGTNGYELWKTDDTAAGTVMVKDINPGTYINILGQTYANSSNPYALTNVNGTLFFTAYDHIPQPSPLVAE